MLVQHGQYILELQVCLLLLSRSYLVAKDVQSILLLEYIFKAPITFNMGFHNIPAEVQFV